MGHTILLTGAFVLGASHALEIDHVTAVTAFVVRRPTLKQSLQFGGQWAIGHGISLLAAATVLHLLLSHGSVPQALLERIVGVALIFLGLRIAYDLQKAWRHHQTVKIDGSAVVHTHSHQHSSVSAEPDARAGKIRRKLTIMITPHIHPHIHSGAGAHTHAYDHDHQHVSASDYGGTTAVKQYEATSAEGRGACRTSLWKNPTASDPPRARTRRQRLLNALLPWRHGAVCIGLLHGAAGAAAFMAQAVVAAAGSFWIVIVYTLVFNFGVLLAMAAYASVMGRLIGLSTGHSRTALTFVQAIAAVWTLGVGIVWIIQRL